MAFKPVACSKYIPGSRNPAPLVPSGPIYVTDMNEVRAAVPSEVRQFPVLNSRPPSAGAAEGASKQRSQPMSVQISGHSPRPSMKQGKDQHGFSLPSSYDSRDWESMSKAQFKPLVAERVSPELLAERRRATVGVSSVPVGFTNTPFSKSTHSKDFFPSYDVKDYAAACTLTNRIGAPNDKCASSVVTAESDKPLPGQYTTAFHRQFQVPSAANGPAVDPALVAHAKALKVNSNTTHWSFGGDRTEYKTVAAEPIPSTAPLIKNRPPSAAPSKAQNIFVAHNVEEARPRKMTAEEMANKGRSTVPLMGNMLGDTSTIGRQMTTNAIATPAYQAVRRELIKSGAPNAGGAAGQASSSATGLAAISSPGLRLGVDKTEYVAMNKAQFQGVYFGQPAKRSASSQA